MEIKSETELLIYQVKLDVYSTYLDVEEEGFKCPKSLGTLKEEIFRCFMTRGTFGGEAL
jgi:hypothetical protein